MVKRWNEAESEWMLFRWNLCGPLHSQWSNTFTPLPNLRYVRLRGSCWRNRLRPPLQRIWINAIPLKPLWSPPLSKIRANPRAKSNINKHYMAAFRHVMHPNITAVPILSPKSGNSPGSSEWKCYRSAPYAALKGALWCRFDRFRARFKAGGGRFPTSQVIRNWFF